MGIWSGMWEVLEYAGCTVCWVWDAHSGRADWVAVVRI